MTTVKTLNEDIANRDHEVWKLMEHYNISRQDAIREYMAGLRAPRS